MKTAPNQFIIAAPASGTGKTSLTLGLLRALKQKGLHVQAFKAGPDYLDPWYHEQASGIPCYNLDSWMMDQDHLKRVFVTHSAQADVSIVEGVMGLFDGASPGELQGSTADLARLLNIPVVLVVDASGMAGSIAAMVAGFANFHPEVVIAGVIANRVGSEKHSLMLAEALEKAQLPPLWGAIPKDSAFAMSEGHLGLHPHGKSLPSLEKCAELIQKNLPLDLLFPTKSFILGQSFETQATKPQADSYQGCIAIAQDKAFSFYYHENLTALQKAGWNLKFFSPLKDQEIPQEADWIYFGGGFPEVFAAELSSNQAMLESIRNFHVQGGKIYAECGGYTYLSQSISVNNQKYPMLGLIPGKTQLTPRLQGFGYREVQFLDSSHPLHQWGLKASQWRGHEFHYTKLDEAIAESPLLLSQKSPHIGKHFGFAKDNIWASYIHLYWAK